MELFTLVPTYEQLQGILKVKCALAVFMILLGGCVLKPVPPTTFLPERPAGHVILAQENSPGSSVLSEGEVALFEADLSSLFAKPDTRFEGKTDARLSEYLVRYYGDIRGGSRVMIAEGIHTSQMSFVDFQKENSSPETMVLAPFGGGSLYFTAIYDLDAKKVTSVRFNAAL